MKDAIFRIEASQCYSNRGTIGIGVKVYTSGGACGTALCAPETVRARYEAAIPYDGEERFGGRGLRHAAAYLNDTVAPALIGKSCADQQFCDRIIEQFPLTPCGVIGASALSQAIAQAAEAATGIPFYRRVRNAAALSLPVPACVACMGSTRYGDHADAGGRPVYSFVAHGFTRFSDAIYALWNTMSVFTALTSERLSFRMEMDSENTIPIGRLSHDSVIWEYMKEAVNSAGYEGKIGFHADLAADHYYRADSGSYHGLLEKAQLHREALIDTIIDASRAYPFLIWEDPLMADDIEGFHKLRMHTDALIVGNELCVSDLRRMEKADAAIDGVVVSPAHCATLTSALAAADYARAHGKQVMTQGWHGEETAIADYAVGFGCSALISCGISFVANRLLAIETDLGDGARLAQHVFDGKSTKTMSRG